MFTGLIADLGRVTQLERSGDGARLRIETSLAGEMRTGDSVAVNGVCLTATAVGDDGFWADAIASASVERLALSTPSESTMNWLVSGSGMPSSRVIAKSASSFSLQVGVLPM